MIVVINTLNFLAEEDCENIFIIRLIDLTETDNYSSYSFTQKTIKPIIYLYGVNDKQATNSSVYAMWDDGEETYSSTITHNGQIDNYYKGQMVTVDGEYVI